MKDHYWDFRVCRWVRYVAVSAPVELVPEQRAADEPQPLSSARG